MNPLRIAILAATTLVLCATFVASASALATRTWVSGVGDDANPCSRTAPCKTWAGAMPKTTENGEIDALDPGGFGAVTISKGITLDGNGFAGVVSAGITGISVNAGATDDVVLRNMSINGAASTDVAPASGCPFAGTVGIKVQGAGSVRIEHVVVQNVTQAAISIVPAASDPAVLVGDTTVTNGCAQGIDVAPTAAGSAKLFVRNTTISRTVTGLHVGAGGHAWITGTSVFDNDTGLLTDGGGIIDAIDANQVAGNGTNGSPTSTSSSAPAQVITVPGPPQVVNVVTPAPDRCIVPTLTGLTVAAAAAKLTKNKCALGKVSTKVSAKKSVGKVLSQKSEAGTTAAPGAAIAVTIGKKKAARKRR